MPSNVSQRQNNKLESDESVRTARTGIRGRPRADALTSDRRSQILKVSARLFAEYGFENTSVRQIADEVNLLAGSLYHHFATKEDILHEILQEPLRRIVEDNIAITKLQVDAEHKLIINTITRFRRHVYDGHFDSIILNDGNFFRRRADFAYVQKAKQRVFDLLETILKDGMVAGLFHPGIDTYLMIGTIARILASAAAWFRSGDIYTSDKPASYSFDRVLDFHLDCILRMIRTPSRLNEPIPREACERLALLV